MSSKIASFAFAVLTFGLATPAFADVAPEPEPDKPVVEQPAEPAKPEPSPEAKQDNGKTDKPEEKVAEKTSGKCSMTDAPERDLAGLALAVLLISGVALGRRRRA